MSKSLYRAKDERKLSGVCGGIAMFFGIDPTVVRIIWVVLSIFNIFVGVLLYIICIFVIPLEPDYIDGDGKEKI